MSSACTTLREPALRPLQLGEIRATGWLKNQLRIQAEGLSGHLDEFWPDISESRWFGGETDGWERAPYWLDGMIPLAYTLDDAKLKEKVDRRVGAILDLQHDDGWLGPRETNAVNVMPQKHDIWSLFLALKMLIQYHDATGDERVVTAVAKCLRVVDRHIDNAPLFDWAQSRWFESLLSIYWLFDRTGEQWLLDLAVKLQAQGFDWPAFFERWPLTEPTEKGRWNFMGHVVNNAMALKSAALWSRIAHDTRHHDPHPSDIIHDMIAQLDRHHGQATGVFTGDECLAGLSPTQGTELCAVAEYAFSLEVILGILGDPTLSDRLEKIVFNALPATFSPDMWAHQYDQQTNQVSCSIAENRTWNTNGPDANLYGLEPNFGCCTANLSQGWPKFAAHLWMRTGDDGLAAVAYAPSIVETQVRGVGVRVETETEYPFRETLLLRVTVDRPVPFPLMLHIPEWTADASGNPTATVQVAGEKSAQPHAGTVCRIDREWKGTTEVLVDFPMRPRATRRYRNALAIERGPLVYALKIGEEWKRVHEDQPHRELPHGDWEVHPTTPWNVALDAHEKTIERDITFHERPVGDCPFSPDGAPMEATMKGRRVPNWRIENGSAGETPESPVPRDQTEGDLEDVTLIPYGCTNLRITEFPTLR